MQFITCVGFVIRGERDEEKDELYAVTKRKKYSVIYKVTVALTVTTGLILVFALARNSYIDICL